MILGIEKGIRNEGYIRAAKRMKIPYRLIDCKANDAIRQIEHVDGFIWHWSHMNEWEKRIARAVVIGAENMGKAVYPDIRTCWMFDDKIYEKYLLESIGAPIIPSYVFFDEKSCERWLRKIQYPIVYKLPGGAGSTNVQLVNDFSEGKKLIQAHFSRAAKTGLFSLRHSFLDKRFDKAWKKPDQEVKGAVLFQDFLPGNTYDIRVTTINEKNIIYKRYVRDHDFRASGSGKIDYIASETDIQAIKIARKITDTIQAQTMTYDFIYDKNGQFRICEMSYGFVEYLIHNAPGWYDRELEFYKGKTDVFEEVVKMIVRRVNINEE